METILILNGPNLNLIGIREPEIYGSTSFEVYIPQIQSEYSKFKIEYIQSNHEGDLIDAIHKYGFSSKGIILNPGAYSHTSIAIADAIRAITSPVVEVHITDLSKRESYRAHSYISEVANHVIMGKGLDGYKVAVDHLLSLNTH